MNSNDTNKIIIRKIFNIKMQLTMNEIHRRVRTMHFIIKREMKIFCQLHFSPIILMHYCGCFDWINLKLTINNNWLAIIRISKTRAFILTTAVPQLKFIDVAIFVAQRVFFASISINASRKIFWWPHLTYTTPNITMLTQTQKSGRPVDSHVSH